MVPLALLAITVNLGKFLVPSGANEQGCRSREVFKGVVCLVAGHCRCGIHLGTRPRGLATGQSQTRYPGQGGSSGKQKRTEPPSGPLGRPASDQGRFPLYSKVDRVC